jgi:DNA-binding winged helix-turn-helix (wHTH) protein
MMPPQSQLPRVLRFGIFEVNVPAGELRENGLKLKLQEQPFQVLCMLLEHPGELVPREELRNRLWPADTFVDFDHGVNAAIKRVRDALGDSHDNPPGSSKRWPDEVTASSPRSTLRQRNP